MLYVLFVVWSTQRQWKAFYVDNTMYEDEEYVYQR